MSRETLAVIIPTLDEAAHVARAVRSSWELRADEVVVSDGGSSDGTTQLASEAGARVITGVRGRGRQQRMGVAATTSQILLFLHADCWMPPRAGDQLRAVMADRQTVVACFRQRIEDPALAFRLIEWGNSVRAAVLQLAYGDQGIVIRRETLERIGGFPEVSLMEDVILLRRLRRLGRLRVLAGPIHVSARRWRRRGLLRQTVLNWSLLAAYSLGVAPDTLARWYRSP